MQRTILIILFLCFSKIALPQLFFSDQGTPLVPPVPCDCDKYSTIVKKIDSTVTELYSVTYEKDGQKYKKTYYVTAIDAWKGRTQLVYRNTPVQISFVYPSLLC